MPHAVYATTHSFHPCPSSSADGFMYGGPVAVIWGWVLIVAMTLTIALSMAEICSSLPTTGG